MYICQTPLPSLSNLLGLFSPCAEEFLLGESWLQVPLQAKAADLTIFFSPGGVQHSHLQFFFFTPVTFSPRTLKSN